MASLNKFRSKHLAIIVVNMIFEELPDLCTTHIQLSVRSLRRAVNFKPRFIHKDHGGFPVSKQRREPVGRWVKKQTLNIPLSN
jgi:hypothetical protein